MAKRPTKRGSVTKVANSSLPAGLINEAPIAYEVGEATITALQIYLNPERKPHGDGPWSKEADKVAWVDEETGLGCIMLRQKDGTISGYVSVSPEHPLFGYGAGAVPLSISRTVHGGVTYGKACEVNRYDRVPWGEPIEERIRVCHGTVVRTRQEYRTVKTTQDEFHDELWWLGFDTNHPGDLVPNAWEDPRKGDVYRDQAFVYENCIALARKLKSMIAVDPATDRSPPLLPPPARQRGDE